MSFLSGENMGPFYKRLTNGEICFWKFVLLLLAAFGALSIGCKSGSQAIWHSESRSPDGQWLASAQTVAQSGFGTGYIGTKVYLNWTKGSQSAVQVLGLSYEFEVPRGITNVEMMWLTPSHLEIDYKGNPTVTFQAIKCGGIDITTRDLSGTIHSVLQGPTSK